jgi:formylmethanofuran dehydrogenase subunit D
MSETFILIPGRTSRQGCGISQGKFTEGYLEETRRLRMASDDMDRLGLTAGDHVKLTSAEGQIDVGVVKAAAGELPAGVLFIAYGDLSSRLMGADTHGSGMPTSKCLDVVLEVSPGTG